MKGFYVIQLKRMQKNLSYRSGRVWSCSAFTDHGYAESVLAPYWYPCLVADTHAIHET